MERYTENLQRLGIECLYAPYTKSLQQHLKESGELYDIVVIFRVTAATRDLPVVRQYCPQAKVIFHPADLHFLREMRQAELLQSAHLASQAHETTQKELHIVKSVDRVMVHSSYEKQVLSEYIEPDRVVVLPWVLDAPGSNAPVEKRRDLIFIGGYGHLPNVDAVLYFVQQIFPLIKARIPGVKFYIVGSNPPQEFEELSDSSIIVTGYVEVLEPLLDQMRLAVVPLRFGAGIKGKIGTSLSAGLPCVGTSMAVEGMPLEPGHDILIADDPEAFADAVVKLYEDDALWHHLSENGVAHVRRHYSFQAGAETISAMLTSLETVTEHG
jgi:glycosyltransferase involved in cell wall biosynthesis